METTSTKEFPLAYILSITTGRSLSSKRMGGVYEILNHMTQSSLFTHQLPQATDKCRPWLLRWFPELVIANGGLDKWIAHAPTCPDEGIKMWLAELQEMEPKLLKQYAVHRIPKSMSKTQNRKA